MNDAQLAAVAARGEVFVTAGAGTGKTSVLVERFVRAVCEEGLDVDSVLVITYTRKAAAELRTRIRAALVERERLDLARALDGAWISTIHSFCGRLLRSHALHAGIDPHFRELDGDQAALLAGEAFSRALERFCAGGDPQRLALLASYGSTPLRTMLTGVYDTLRSAGRPLRLEFGIAGDLDALRGVLRGEAEALLAAPSSTELQKEAARAALGLGALPEQLAVGFDRTVRGEGASGFVAACAAVRRAALERLAANDIALLQELLDLYGAEYAAAKEAVSGVDFEDLQLIVREMLLAAPSIREIEQLRFRSVMVDEFQDTNALQSALIDLLCETPGDGPAKDVFFVGDEFQSIYGFRHADVAVFRERGERAAQHRTLDENYRSRPGVLAAVNHLFATEFGAGYQPLRARGAFAGPVPDHEVELLLVDRGAYAESVGWREAEADRDRAAAARARRWRDAPAASSCCSKRAHSQRIYDEALRRVGLATYRSTGRRYLSQQQVVDLLMYLRLLRNRYDDEALVTVLASPFVGLSNDALALIRAHAARRPLFTAIERTIPTEIAEPDQRLLRAFKQRFTRLVALSGRISLERLCESVVAEHDYDLAVLARGDGKRRYANLRKLMRLARSYEEVRGRDLEGFVTYLDDHEAVGASQAEAVSEDEHGDAIRLMTIHAAKGLDFEVVVVADSGRGFAAAHGSDEILALPDGRLGFKARLPGSRERHAVFAYEAVHEAERAAERAETLRLYYVAMTRARQRLLVSGATTSSGETPIGWLIARFGIAEQIERAPSPFVTEAGDASILVYVERTAVPFEPAPEPPLERVPGPAEQPQDRDGEAQLTLFAGLQPPVPESGAPLPELGAVAPAPVHRVRRLSYSALALFEGCAYRYYAERVGGLSERRAAASVAGGGLAATELGDAVHRLLELVDPHAPALPSLEPVSGWYPHARPEDLERIAALVAAYCGSATAKRVAALEGARPECPFAFEHDEVLFHGRLDLLQRSAGRALVVDYKTNRLNGAAPAEIVESEYAMQRIVYALACLRAGASEVEVTYLFLERPDDAVSTTFAATQLGELEAVLSEAIARINAGVFTPTPSVFRCGSCPALDIVCAGTTLPD